MAFLLEQMHRENRRAMLKDTAALVALSVITILLFTATHILFGLYNRHRATVAENWTKRGIQALQLHQPDDAVIAFRSALPYTNDEGRIQQLLAEALAAAGRSDEALAYYRTLWEKEPGNGPINLALARLATQQGNSMEAWTYYHAALDGTWNGDGSWRRPIVRLELAEYLIQQKRFDQARGELLIAAGNANEDVNLRLRIASLLEQAQDYGNALNLYRKIMQHGSAPLPALEGAGRTAYERGNYLLARDYLERAFHHSDFPKETEDRKVALRDELRDSIHILLLYPSRNLTSSERARRIAEIERTTEARRSSCVAEFEAKNQPIPKALNDLSAQWSARPQIAKDSAMAERVLGLSYQLEQETAKSCGQPTGVDLLLLKIAAAPQSVEAQ